MVRQTSKRVGEGSLHFQFQLSTLGPSVSPQIKPKGLSQLIVGAVPINLFANIYFFLSFV